MADATLTLDQIIKKKKIRPFKNQNAKVVTKKATKAGNKPKATVKRLGNNRPLKTPATKAVSDARNKIIQKKRLKMGDARERLGELARQGDARERLNKKKGNLGVAATRLGPKGIKARIGGPVTNLTQKKAALIKKQLGVQTGNNFVKQNQTRMQGKNLTRTVAGVAGKAARNPGAAGVKTARNNIKPAANRPVAKAQRNQTVVTIRNDRANQQRMRAPKQMQVRPQNVRIQRAPYRPQVITSDMVWESPQEMYYEQPMFPQPVYRQARPIMMEQVRPTRLQITTPNTYRDTVYVDEYDAPIRQRPVYVQQAPMPRARPAPMRVKKPQAMSSNLAARLDQKQGRQQQGRQQQGRQQQRPQQGHKVLVTNLHPCVSGEDMEELFSTIGTIVTARMVRDGVAEAVFLKEGDALRSVEVFHNRQLDGLPMNVTLVKNKSNAQRGGPQPKSVLKAARGRTGYYV